MLKNLNRIVKSLLCIYAIQFLLVACIDDGCQCGPSRTYETSIVDFDFQTLDTSGFNPSEISETVFKNSFGIQIYISTDLQRIAKFKSKNDITSLGFSNAYACSCVEDEYISINKINAVEIMVTDTETQATTAVTENFKAYLYGDEIDLANLINLQDDNYWSSIRRIELELDKENNIPNTAVFSIKLILSDGENIVKETEEITFI